MSRTVSVAKLPILFPVDTVIKHTFEDDDRNRTFLMIAANGVRMRWVRCGDTSVWLSCEVID